MTFPSGKNAALRKSRADKISYPGHVPPRPMPAPAVPAAGLQAQRGMPPAISPAALHQASGGRTVESGRTLYATSNFTDPDPDDADGLQPLTELAWIFAGLCVTGLCAGIGLGVAQHFLK